MVVIQGPRFSTRAESRWFQAMGWDTINMTAFPEGYLARELELCYANISLITDYDVGVEGTPPVTNEEVIRVFNENNSKLRQLLFAMIPALPEQRDCPCATALQGAAQPGPSYELGRLVAPVRRNARRVSLPNSFWKHASSVVDVGVHP